ncbi:MAG: hypothetical protein GY832_44280, partial [Chloroflexi bacterium]|nr:hypothetical protein [Chloroflexota bacterium]
PVRGRDFFTEMPYLGLYLAKTEAQSSIWTSKMGAKWTVKFLSDSLLARDKVIGLEFSALCIKKQATIIDKTGHILDPNNEADFFMYIIELIKGEGEHHHITARL